MQPVLSVSSSRTAIIEALLERGQLSRSDLADLTGLSRSSLTGLSLGLMKLGLVQEVSRSHDKQQKGRPRMLLSLNGAHRYFIGVGLSETSPLMVLTNLQGDPLAHCRIMPTADPQAVAAAIDKGVTSLIQSSSLSRRKIVGIGIALSGYVNHTQGVCVQSNLLKWQDVPLAAIGERATGIHTFVDNNANAVATGQKLFGLARKLKSFISIIMLNHGIGGGSYINGRLYRGDNGAAGEIGHCTVVPGGAPCGCGKRGCLDLYATSSAIVQRAAELGLNVEDVAGLESLAAKGVKPAMELLREAGTLLGIVIANAVQINNPERVLITDMAGFGDGLFTTSTRQAIENNILPRLISTTRVDFHSVEETFLARSAASIAAHQYLIERAH